MVRARKFMGRARKFMGRHWVGLMFCGVFLTAEAVYIFSRAGL